MAISFYEILLDASALALGIVLIFYLVKPSRQLPLPPSPKSDPIIGHLRYLVDTTNDHILYAKLSKELNCV